MRVVYTKHAKKKFKELAKIGVKLLRRDISVTIKNSEYIDEESDKPNIIASRSIDEKHILRVVFKVEDDIINVITFYPARVGRYYEKKTSKN